MGVGSERGPALGVIRTVVILIVDVCISFGACLLLLRQFGVHTELTSDPPICANHYGDRVSCDNPGWLVPSVSLLVMLLLLFLLIFVQRRKGWI